jgi:hypothetical protein
MLTLHATLESLPLEIPAGQTFILVKYGEESGQTRDSLGLTITVARNQSKTVSDLFFLANIHTAKAIANEKAFQIFLSGNSVLT